MQRTIVSLVFSIPCFLLVGAWHSQEAPVHQERFRVIAVCKDGFDVTFRNHGENHQGRVSFQEGSSPYSGIKVGDGGEIRIFTEEIVSGRVQVRLMDGPWRAALIEMGADPNC